MLVNLSKYFSAIFGITRGRQVRGGYGSWYRRGKSVRTAAVTEGGQLKCLGARRCRPRSPEW